MRCVEVCTRGAISKAPYGKIQLDRQLCRTCTTLDCAAACPAKGLIVYGEEKSVAVLLNIVEQDAMALIREARGEESA